MGQLDELNWLTCEKIWAIINFLTKKNKRRIKSRLDLNRKKNRITNNRISKFIKNFRIERAIRIKVRNLGIKRWDEINFTIAIITSYVINWLLINF